jgi:hypothetical protein
MVPSAFDHYKPAPAWPSWALVVLAVGWTLLALGVAHQRQKTQELDGKLEASEARFRQFVHDSTGRMTRLERVSTAPE